MDVGKATSSLQQQGEDKLHTVTQSRVQLSTKLYPLEPAHSRHTDKPILSVTPLVLFFTVRMYIWKSHVTIFSKEIIYEQFETAAF